MLYNVSTVLIEVLFSRLSRQDALFIYLFISFTTSTAVPGNRYRSTDKRSYKSVFRLIAAVVVSVNTAYRAVSP